MLLDFVEVDSGQGVVTEIVTKVVVLLVEVKWDVDSDVVDDSQGVDGSVTTEELVVTDGWPSHSEYSFVV